MTRGERAAIKQYVSDMTEEEVKLEVRNNRVFRVMREDLGDVETLAGEAWEWRAGVERGQQLL
jgi:putative component of toxin-antitoxin plasmid stabilization module